jgi:hypothetical protein
MTDEELTATPDTNDQHDQNDCERAEIFYDPGKVSYWVECEEYLIRFYIYI